MKDLYTFDCTSPLALETYYEVRQAYAHLFDELKLPYLIAEADSGDMGGNLSHEFHFPTSKGEDHVISCTSCDYVANEELAESSIRYGEDASLPAEKLQVWRGISRDRETLINVWYPLTSSSGHSSLHPEVTGVNLHAIKALFSDADVSIDNPLPFWGVQNSNNVDISPLTKPPKLLLNLVDGRLSQSTLSKIVSNDPHLPFWPESKQQIKDIEVKTITRDPSTQNPLNLLRIKDGDHCPRCHNGALKVQKAIELGHTFHLGTRYSEPLGANVTLIDSSKKNNGGELQQTYSQVPLQMGCHGIGVSRMIGAVADTLADEKGLNWPRVMAPFEIVIVPSRGREEAAVEVYDTLNSQASGGENQQPDLILDDRTQSFAWKMQDADLVGYPIIVVVGKRWKEGVCEVQCRRLQIRQDIRIDELQTFTNSLLSQL
jgi:prolyl-tRNA synthetase